MSKTKCPVADKLGVCRQCREHTSLCEPCCPRGAVEPGDGASSDECICWEAA